MALDLRTTRIFEFGRASKTGKLTSLSRDEAERIYQTARDTLFDLVEQLETSNQVGENLRDAIVDFKRAAVERAAVIGAMPTIKRALS